MDVGIMVEEPRWQGLLRHGVGAGLCGGVALGVAQGVISLLRHEDVLASLRLVAYIAVGPAALRDGAHTAWLLMIGVTLHFFLATLFGALFVALLALTYQLSARSWVLVACGFLFGFLLWEVNFLAVLPGLYPRLTADVGLANQLWKGLFAYSAVYGPALALYVAATRPGVVASWRG